LESNRAVSWLAILVLLLSKGDVPCTAADDFDTVVAPLLARKCLACHNPTEKKGGFDLSGAKSAMAGGEGGVAVIAGQPADSLLWERVSQNEMPPKKPLSDADKQIIETWIKAGAKWGRDPIDPFRYTSESRAGYDWWSLRAIKRPLPPKTADDVWARNAIDRFILAGLDAQGLKPSRRADKRLLIRRLSFDLLGLPPEPIEVAAFLADDSPDAYSRLVDYYLKSPHYGERWGRHWLDVVRFGESQGFERDKLRQNAWLYRDWVIAALNDDMPYDEFVCRQLAGDVMHPNDPRGTIATGFLVAAPWDEVGQTQQSAAMRAVVRQDELEDLIGATAQTFLGLTVNCARCHDHKFDPVTQAEYYRLAAVFAGVKHGDRESLRPGSASGQGFRAADRREELTRIETGLIEQVRVIEDPVRREILAARSGTTAPAVELPRPIARWEFDGDLRDSLGGLHGTAHGQSRVEKGSLILDGKDSYVATAPLQSDLSAKSLEVWLMLTNVEQRGGGAISVQSSSGAIFDALVFGEKEPGKWMAGSNGFSRWQSFNAPPELEAGRSVVKIVVVYGSDRTITAYRNGRRYGAAYTAPSLAAYETGKSQVLFGLRHSPPGGDRFLGAAIDRAALYDRALAPEEVAALAGVASDIVTDEQILAGLSRDGLRRYRQLQFELSNVQAQNRLLAGGKTYAVVPAQPEATFILARGNPAQKEAAIGPGGIRALAELSPDLGLAEGASEGDRRKRLAEWITDLKNPLTPRVIVNRLWHYHFGTGIVDTPNDLGFNGGRPSHPELLDWLAAELIHPISEEQIGTGDQQNKSEIAASNLTGPKSQIPWSLKHIHRLIVTSATYCQSSTPNPQAATIDAGNRLLWRFTPQRLEAEALRDAMLVVAGEFNPQMGGPGFQDFKTFTFNSQFYEPIDPVGHEFNRRTVYRTWVRSGRNEFLDVFDCPDPSTTAPRRAVTTTPLQALALLNNSFTLRMASRLAARCERAAPGALDNQVALVYDLAFNRRPQQAELVEAKEFAVRHGLAALCRVIFNSNEFLYVD
jgi:mono/diheme cytochrome c family protein